MAFELDIGFASTAGRKDINEDFCAAMMPQSGTQEVWGAIVAIADGVSTGGMGREAAQTTVTSLVRDYYGTPETWHTTVALDRIISAQNAWLCGINRRRHPVLGLTTLSALVLRGQSYTLAHVGDTRVYLLRAGKITLLTNDHVVNHPDFSHQLLRSVGAEDHLVADYSQGELQLDDRFVLLTDGVHGCVRERQLPGMVGGMTAQAASQGLVQAALDAGSADNATAMVVHVRGLLEATLIDADLAARALPIPPRLRVGAVLDGMTVTAIIADSGINLLYQVRDAATRTLYALKTLNPARAHDPQERAMLAHEAWLAKRLQTAHAAQHLVAQHDQLPGGGPPSAFYVLYDWHAGETLQQQLGRGQRIDPSQIVDVMIQALKALGYLHRQGVIHRDVKPANLHLGEDGVLRLLDLGVALSGKEPAELRQLHAGTPSYVNPEQWGYNSGRNGAPEALADAQSDLFALGVTLYQMLTGKLPYGEVLPYQVGRYFRDPTPPSRHNPQVPIWLDHIALKAVSRDQRLRFETAEEMLLALQRGASRPIAALQASALIERDPTAIWKLGLALSVIFNLLLTYWLLFLPK